MSRLSLRRVVLATITAIAALGGPGLVVATTAAQMSALGTLTVTGFGSARAPAETVRMQILVGSSEYFGGPPTERTNTPNADSGDTAPRSWWRRAMSMSPTTRLRCHKPGAYLRVRTGGPGAARLDITLENADLERVNAVFDAAGAGASEDGLVIIGIGVDYEIADCTGLLSEAREAAMADA